jgi:hypothetical protein
MAIDRPTGPRWTVMVFMGAATVEGSLSLESAADDDIKEMEAVGSADDRLEILVERHDDTGVTRQHIGRKYSPFNSDRKHRDQAELDGKTLIRFIEAALRASSPRPDDRTMLVMWGHTYDFAFGRKRKLDGTIDALDFAELTSKLDEFQKSMGGGKLDIIAFDSCEVSTVEMACQLHPYADYLLSSEVGIPMPGWPYDRIFDRIVKPMGDRGMEPAEFGAYIVRRFCESYQAKDDQVSLTLLDLGHAKNLANHVGWLAQKLALAIGDVGGLGTVADLIARSQTEPGRPYVDVADLCVNLMRDSGDAAIIDAANAVGDLLVTPRPAVVGLSESGGGNPFVVEHGRNAGRLARLNGISLYAPHLAPHKDVDVAESLYKKFTFVQGTLWSDLVHAIARA